MGGLVLMVFFFLSLITALVGWSFMLIQKKQFYASQTAASSNTNASFQRTTIRKWSSTDSGYYWMGVASSALVAILGLWLLFKCFKIIDAGEVGVQTRFGKVLDVTLTEGFNTKSPFVKVHTYNIRVNEYTMSRVQGEGAVAPPDSISSRTKDDLNVDVDLTIRWSVDPTSASIVYRTISPNMKGIIGVVVRPSSRSLVRDIVPQYTLNELNQNRVGITKEIFGPLAKEFKQKGLILDSILIRDIYPPVDIDKAIQTKLARQQELEEQTYKIQIAEAQAEIRRTEAKGIADAQEIIQKELTPIYVQYEAIQAYKELAGSPNTTFVILPTSPNGAGMPLILGAK